jgi:hypothetical protein
VSVLDSSAPKGNGHNGDVSALSLALLRKKPPDEAAKALAGILSENRSIKPNKQLLSRECGVSVGRINVALNGSKPRRPKPSPKTLAELDTLFKTVRNAASAMRWRGIDYQHDELQAIDRQISKFLAAHPDVVVDWRTFGGLPVILEHAVDALAFLVETIAANDRVGYR